VRRCASLLIERVARVSLPMSRCVRGGEGDGVHNSRRPGIRLMTLWCELPGEFCSMLSEIVHGTLTRHAALCDELPNSITGDDLV
jgi:hypothetical protein